MAKHVDYEVKYTETIVINDFVDDQDAIEQANAQMEMLAPVQDGYDWKQINVSDV